MEIHNTRERTVAAAPFDRARRRAVDRAPLLRQHAEQKMFCRSKRALVISEAMAGLRARVMTAGAA
jgi:hypothetical protein